MKESNIFGGDARDSIRELTDEELSRVTGGEDEDSSDSGPKITNNIWCQFCNAKTSHHRTTDGKFECDICGTVNL